MPPYYKPQLQPLVYCWAQLTIGFLQNLSLHMNKQWAHNDFAIYATACFAIRTLCFRIVWTVRLCLALRVENQIHLALKLSRGAYSKKLLKRFQLCAQIFGNKLKKRKGSLISCPVEIRSDIPPISDSFLWKCYYGVNVLIFFVLLLFSAFYFCKHLVSWFLGLTQFANTEKISVYQNINKYIR